MGISLDADMEDDDDREVHDINVTPFIDVMLVLLIIFMVAAPLSTVDLPVDLPSSTAPGKEAGQADLRHDQGRSCGCGR
jgi:biopolymer transport protein ExbD